MNHTSKGYIVSVLTMLLILFSCNNIIPKPYLYSLTHPILFLIIIILLVPYCLKRVILPTWNALDIIILFYFIYMCLNKPYSIESLYNSAIIFLTYFCVRINKKFIEINIIKYSLLLLSSIFILQFFYLKYASNNNLYNQYGFFENTTLLALYLSLVFPINYYTISSRHLRILFSIIVLSIILYLSRTGFIALILSIIIINLKTIALTRKHIYCVLISLVILIYTLLFHMDITSIYGRLLIWKMSAFSIDSSNLLLGKGHDFVYNHFLSIQEIYFQKNRPLYEQLLAGQVRTTLNEYVKIILEHGLVGLIILIIGSVKLFYTLKHSDENKVLLIPFFSFIFISFFSYPTLSQTICVVLIVFIGIANNNVSLHTHKENNKLIYEPYIIILISCFFLYNNTQTYLLYHRWNNLLNNHYDKYNEAAFLDTGKQLIKKGSIYPTILNIYSKKLLAIGLYDDALNFLEISNKTTTTISTMLLIAQIHEKKQNFDIAEEYYIKSINSCPKMFSQKFLLFSLYKKKGDSKAIVVANEIAAFPVKAKSKDVDNIKLFINNYLSKL